ncbi:unnamed protein product [Chondrus crispus]|uniref:Uncharacterized protein n=1 Tax=Chondrus crispus TaxID=2769 RepID=R7QPV5_CHOCR|nr:unnamed protein product [Chondrus crispus]CDF39425.1 unnamed protein product [Chondrus crispus]|eukprot:XP_005719336.1 unnamed protein product [Chondrus crispus]
MRPTGQVELGATRNRTAESSARSALPFGEVRSTLQREGIRAEARTSPVAGPTRWRGSRTRRSTTKTPRLAAPPRLRQEFASEAVAKDALEAVARCHERTTPQRSSPPSAPTHLLSRRRKTSALKGEGESSSKDDPTQPARPLRLLACVKRLPAEPPSWQSPPSRTAGLHARVPFLSHAPR